MKPKSVKASKASWAGGAHRRAARAGRPFVRSQDLGDLRLRLLLAASPRPR
jgi:hypothetical protein